MGSQASQTEQGKLAEGVDSCPLGVQDQVRNVVLVAVNTGLSYLASPVLYVGMVHAALCKALGWSDAVCNLPATAYLVMCVLPLFVAWYFPAIRLLKRIMVVCYGALAVVTAVVVVVLLLPLPAWVQLAVIIFQGGVIGGARTVAVAIEFEVLGLAVSPSRRGVALGLAYGAGPILAIVGSLTSQLLLTGTLGPIYIGDLEFPMNFAVLFAVTVPCMALAAFLSSQYVIPLPEVEATRQPFRTGVFGGFGKFLGDPVVLLAMIVAVLMMAGYTIISNMALYTKQILGEVPEQYAGYQLTVRFSFKAVTGLLLGWLLTKTHPKAGLFITAFAGLGAVLWAVVAPREWILLGFASSADPQGGEYQIIGSVPVFLLSFGLMGSAELFGIYITNYILCCSPRALMRRYMAFTMLTLFPAAPASTFFGSISDQFQGTERAYGFQLSFAVAAAFIALGIILALFLPARPQPRENP
jgi:hypothetical protein